MAKLNDKQKIIVFASSAALLCAAAGGGVYWAKGLVEEKVAVIATDEQQVQTAKTKVAGIPKLEQDVIILRENVDAYTRILPDHTFVSDFLRVTNGFARHAGVTVPSFLKGTDGKRGKYSHYSYLLNVEGTLWQFLEFVNAFENHDRFIRVVSFNVKPADRDELDKAAVTGDDPRHSYQLVVETYVYNGGAADSVVEIPKYPQKRERIREAITAGMDSLPLEAYQLGEVAGRRDIFLDPRARIGGLSNGDNPRSLQLERIQEFMPRVSALVELRDRWEAESNYLVKQRLERQLRTEAERLDGDIARESPRITSASLLPSWNQDVVGPVGRILGQLDGESGGQTEHLIGIEHIESMIADMRSAVRKNDFDTAIARHDALKERLVFEPDDPRAQLAVEAEMLRLNVEAAMDFAQISLDINGVVVFDEGRRGLLLNGSVFEEGDYVQDDLLLRRVGREEAEFVFRGFRLAKKW